MKSRWLVILLIASIAANLALAGFIVGQRSVGPLAGRDATPAFPRWARTLPDERRAALRPIVRDYFRSIRPRSSGLREHQQRVRSLIAADPYDAEALRGALTDMRGQQDTTNTAVHLSFVEFVSALTPAERQRLSEDMAQPRMGLGPPRHRRREGEGPGPR
ncbi:MAG: periplasmic heavy metal sensor [Pseudomonadota bacterium]